MLIAALLYFVMNPANELANQGLIDQVGTYINQSIDDTNRQETLQAVVDAMKKEQAKMALHSNGTRQSLIELDSDPASERDQFDTVLNAFNRDQQKSYKAMLDLRFQLKENMSRAEWEEAFGGK